MPKVPTVWTINTSLGTVDPYDTAGSYDGGGTTAPIDLYDGVATGMSYITNKIPSVWSQTGKTATQWSANSAASVGLRAYDSGTTPYDSSSLVYDGNTLNGLNAKVPTVWSTT